jgi:ribosomal protein L40E
MNCVNCGEPLPDSAKFCPNCGTRVQQQEQKQEKGTFCTSCGAPLAPGASFCTECGIKVASSAQPVVQPPQQAAAPTIEPVPQQVVTPPIEPVQTTTAQETPQPAPEQPQWQQPESAQVPPTGGKLLAEMTSAGFFEGLQSSFGFAESNGTLKVYDNRLEFHKKWGNAVGSMFGAAGVAVARQGIKNDPVDIYPVSDIRKVYVGKYGGINNSLIVELKSKRTLTFTTPLPGSTQPQYIVDRLHQYIKR